jgi:hypothetical protein
MLIGRTAGATAHLVQTLRQTLGLMHFEVQQHGFWIGRLTIDQLIAGRMLAFGGAILNEAAGGNMRRGLANVGAYADAINRHGSKLSTAKKLKLAEVTISILDCLGVRRSGYGGRLAFVNMDRNAIASSRIHRSRAAGVFRDTVFVLRQVRRRGAIQFLRCRGSDRGHSRGGTARTTRWRNAHL